jgi:hypothetical protein
VAACNSARNRGVTHAYRLIREAILAKRQVVATYQGHRRELCPHVLGTKNGRPQALFFQFGGGSASALPPEGDWRCIPIDGLEDIVVRDGAWFTGVSHGHPERCVDTVDVGAARLTAGLDQLGRTQRSTPPASGYPQAMGVAEPVVSCQDCGTRLPDSTTAPVDERMPCPRCGSLRRHVAISVSDTITVHEQLLFKARTPGEKRPFVERKAGDDYSWSRGRWVSLRRVIDRRTNRYQERIEDPVSGEVIRDVDEPLTKHVGRGSATPKPPG